MSRWDRKSKFSLTEDKNLYKEAHLFTHLTHTMLYSKSLFCYISVLFFILFPKVLKNQSEFYTLLKKKFMTYNVVFIILALPLFFLYRLYFNKKMNEDLTKIS